MQYAKAAAAGAVAAIGSLTAALGDGHLTLIEGLTAASATLVAALAVWNIPYKPSQG